MSRSSQTTRGYDNTRVQSISHPETPESQKATVVLRNYDQAFTSLDFEAYTGVISYGINTGASRTAWAVGTAYALDDIRVPTTASGYQYRCSVAGTSHASTEPIWPTDLGVTVADNTVTWEMDGNTGDEYSYTAPLKVMRQNFISTPGKLTCTLSLIGKLDQLAQDKAKAKYTQLSTDANTVKTLISAVAAASTGLNSAFNGYDVITMSYDDSGDSLIDTFIPADYFSINVNQTRLEKIEELLAYTKCKMRVEKDGKIHVFVPTTASLRDTYTTGEAFTSYANNVRWLSQTFTPASSYMATSVILVLARTNTPGTVTVSIRATDGAGQPTGPDLAEGTTNGDTLPTSLPAESREITFTIPVAVVSNTKYAILVHGTAVDAVGRVLWRGNSATPSYTGGLFQISLDSGVTWTDYAVDMMFSVYGYDYAYQFNVPSAHTFFTKGLRLRFINPNEEIVKSHPDHVPQYTGSATSAASYALLPKTRTTYRRLVSDAQAALIAAAKIDISELDDEKGLGIVPMNMGQEVWDYVKVTDSRENDSRVGNIQFLQRNVAVHSGKSPLTFSMTFAFGKLSIESMNLPSISELMPTLSNEIILGLLNDLTDYLNQLGNTVYTKGLYYVKPRVFTTTPTVPYDLEDLWIDDTVIKRCTTAKDTSGSYAAGDWTALTIDELADGTYGKVLATEISAGHLKLTSAALFEGKWYNLSGVSIAASTGINIWGTDNALTTRGTEAGTIQCYVGADGKFYAGAGAVWLDSSGINVDGETLKFYSGITLEGILGYNSGAGWVELASETGIKLTLSSGDNLNLLALDNTKIVTIRGQIKPNTDSAQDLGDATTPLRWRYIYTDAIDIGGGYNYIGTSVGDMDFYVKNTAGNASVLAMYVEDGDVPVLQMNSHKIAGVLDPTADQEAATKAYVDNKGKTASVDNTTLEKDTIYQNTTGFPLLVTVNWGCAIGGTGCMTIGAASPPITLISDCGGATVALDGSTIAIVPVSWFYKAWSGGTATILSSQRLAIGAY